MMNVSIGGPLLGAAAGKHVLDFNDDLLFEAGSLAIDSVQNTLNRRIIRHTPYYETHIQLFKESPNTAVVNDSGIVYGPWLEGISRRNQRLNWPGYWAFRLARARLERDLPRIADRMVQQLCSRLGG